MDYYLKGPWIDVRQLHWFCSEETSGSLLPHFGRNISIPFILHLRLVIAFHSGHNLIFVSFNYFNMFRWRDQRHRKLSYDLFLLLDSSLLSKTNMILDANIFLQSSNHPGAYMYVLYLWMLSLCPSGVVFQGATLRNMKKHYVHHQSSSMTCEWHLVTLLKIKQNLTISEDFHLERMNSKTSCCSIHYWEGCYSSTYGQYSYIFHTFV